MRKLLVLLLFSIAAGAEVVEDLHLDLRPEVLLAETSKWRAIRRFHKRDLKIEFVSPSDNKKVIHRYQAPPTSLLLQTELVRWGGLSFLVTIWQDGNHVTALRVFDPLSKSAAPVLERSSAGRVKYSVNELGLDVEFLRADKATMSLVDDKISWQAVKK